MDFRDYLSLARELADGPSEAHWRSSVSRAYYAAFHVASEFVNGLGFRVPQADRAHSYLWKRLANAGEPDIIHTGNRLNDLRGQRNNADYGHGRSFTQETAKTFLGIAENVIDAMDATTDESLRTQITDTMKVYERDILREETWKPTP